MHRKKTRFESAEGLLLTGMFFCLAGYSWIRHCVAPHTSFLTLLDLPRLPLRLLALPEILFAYAKIWFFPWPLHMGRIISVEVLKIRTLIFEWSIFLAIFLAIFFYFRKRLERLFLVWIAVSLLPVIQIFPIYFNAPDHVYLAVSEYLLYFASVGLLGLLAHRFGRFFVIEGEAALLKSVPTALLGAALTLFSFLVIWRCGEYGDRITFFEQTVRYAPWHAVAYTHLGVAYQQAGDPRKAEALYQKALSLAPNDGMPYVNLGTLAEERGELDKAEQYYKRGLRLDARESALYNLGLLSIEKKEWRQAVSYFGEAVQADPFPSPVVYNEMAHAYWELGEKEKALRAAEEGLKIHPSDPALQTIKRWLEERLRRGKTPWGVNSLIH